MKASIEFYVNGNEMPCNMSLMGQNDKSIPSGTSNLHHVVSLWGFSGHFLLTGKLIR
jgi:hypothetical protein